MKFQRASLETCHNAVGLVILIDVLRAFSTAAYAFSRGAKQIILVSTVEEALNLRAKIADSKVMGEIGGLPPVGFDFGNSPSQISSENLNGLILIQRTSAGTQGAVRCVKAEVLIAASFVVASSTVHFVENLNPAEVTFVITGNENNDEDNACADYLEALFRGEKPDSSPYIRRVFESRDAVQHLDPNQPLFPESDLHFCTDIDRFGFVMPIKRETGRLIMACIQ